MRPSDLLAKALAQDDGQGKLVFLTGAGISAESGLPTFRGPEGCWQVGSRNYHPMELATKEAFDRKPTTVWGWYLHRRWVYERAKPNPGHRALAGAERRLQDRFHLVTQNIDGLHLRAGNTPERTFQIHGNIANCRCADACPEGARPFPLPLEQLGAWPKGRALGPDEERRLRCRCGGWLRPHVLWFDEYYDEALFRFESTLSLVDQAVALVVIGTSGSTNLPTQMCHTAARRRIPFVVIDLESTAFAELALSHSQGRFLVGPASTLLPQLTDGLG